MSLYTHKNKEILSGIERISISDYMKSGIFELRKKGYVFDLRNSLEPSRLKKLLNDPKNTTYKSAIDLESGFYHWHNQKVDYVQSNLGSNNGVVFYFVCNGCRYRAKYLYQYNSCYEPLCRKCCRLKYTAPSKNLAVLASIFRKSHLSSADRALIVKLAGITMDDIANEH